MKQAITINSGIEYERSKFSGGEIHVRLPRPAVSSYTITANIHCSDDVMELLMVTDALRRAGAHSISLMLPYLPYARQDRVCAPGEALSLRVFCDLINAQRYDSVTVWDAHSDTALALLDRVFNYEQSTLMSRFPFVRSTTVLVAPDAGAIKKVAKTSKMRDVPFVRADKSRDPATGEITGTVVYTEHIGDKRFLIADDICDGGRTFIELAKALRPLTNAGVDLYVTHGIFSRGTDVFDGLIDHVYVANSFVDDLPSNFTLLKV